MRQKKSQSVPLKGMNRGTHHHQLQNTEYPLAVNVNIEGEVEGYNLELEPSNYAGVIFPNGYKIIGFKNDHIKQRTYYFLTNTEEIDINSEDYKRSSIGYVDVSKVLDNDFNNGLYNTDCGECTELSRPLEEIIQTPSLKYVELLHDRCISLANLEEEGFNFDIKSPIKKVEINQEKLGTTLYWNDFRNPPRYLNVSEVEENGQESYVFEVFEPCEDPTFQNCINIDRLRLFPKHNRITLDPTEQQTGGNLKMGTYEFWASYCDLMGNEMTQYCTPTNPISIWDENNSIQGQTETDEFTNYAIKIKVNNLDVDNFKYYKVAVVERNNIANTQSVFLAGIYPTTDDTIIYTHSGSSNDDIYIARGNVSIKKRMDFQTLNAVKPEWDRAKGTMVSGDTLFHYGLVQKEEINLQPVMNLFGSLLHAQTSASSENLYKSAIATSKYKFYPRNEVIPFGIRLLYTDGGYSATFPLIARPALSGEKDTLTESDPNYASLVNNTSCITTSRDEKWQVYNTARPHNELCTNIEDNSTEVIETVTQSCVEPSVNLLPSGQVLLQPNEEYYTLEDYLSENPSAVPGLVEALNEDYIQTCTACNTDTPDCDLIFYGDCEIPSITGTRNFVGNILNEQVETVYKDSVDEYVKAVPPTTPICNVYERNSMGEGYVVDPSMTPFINCFAGTKGVYKRDSDFLNESCAYATDVLNIIDPTQFNGSIIFMNYAGSEVKADLLQSAYDVAVSDSDFENKLHVKAQFFKVEKVNRNKIFFEITKSTECNSLDDLPSSTKIRYTFYDKCSAPTVLGGGIVDLTEGFTTILDVSTFPGTNFYVAIDSPIETAIVDRDCDEGEEDLVEVHRVQPPCGCFSMYTRDEEVRNIRVTYDGIRIDKESTYQATCTFNIPKVNDCDPIPYRKFQTAYWESTENYDDNKELWDSSFLEIAPSDISGLSFKDRQEFLDYYVEGGSSSPEQSGGFYVLKNVDFRCQPIRHFKMPDNTTAPYIIDNITFKKNADSIIFPLGVEIDSAVIRTVISLAYNNNLINKKQRDSIEGFEIMRGDNSVSKSVIANGIAFDMCKYTKEGDDIYFPNFPFNDLGFNKYVTNTKLGNDLVNHPSNAVGNYMYSFLSPDLLLHKPAIPTEASLQGYITGASKQQFVASDEHSEWTILGGKARNMATDLAEVEAILEGVIGLAQITKELWFQGGLSFGANIGAAIATGAYTLAVGVSQYMKIGKYRYDWLKVFRDLGRTYNFASMQVGVGDYNKMLRVGQYSDNYLRKLAVRKYLTDDYLTVVDENTGQEVKINNKVRENSTFLSFGENFEIVYENNYKVIDNNRLNSLSSNFVASEVNCVENKEFSRNVASPYFSLKNYIPDQHGTIDSIKWLTTNYIFNKNEDTSCKTIFGGTHVISRFSWRRKVPIFRKNAIKHPDKQPFMYSRNDNIGYPRFYCDYELTDGDNMWSRGIGVFPDINSDYRFDCETGRTRMYVKPPSKLYTSVHGIVDFLVESEINCNFRYAGKEKKDWFYPQAQDLGNWLQESTLSLSEPNSFFYNNTYTFPVSNSTYKVLDKTYSKELWMKRLQQPNATTWSQKDVNENDLTNPWNVYKPLDWYEFKTNNGKLVDLHNIESNQFLARFENKLMLHNAIDNIAERITPENRNLGVAGMFLQRPMEFKATDLGFAGTQNTEIVSTPYGHFWCDAKRGKVFKVDQNGQGMEVISEMINGKPSGMKNWFREHLPFKIQKFLPQIDTDNKFNGLGLNMWWDDRFERVFITKRDYAPKKICVEDSCLTRNLLTNGNFNFGLQGWSSMYEGDYTIHNGKAWFSDSSDIAPKLSQNILQVGKTYNIKFDLYINPGCDIYSDAAFARIWVGNNVSEMIMDEGTTQVEITMLCEENTVFSLQSRYACPYTFPPNTISFDNVCVTEVLEDDECKNLVSPNFEMCAGNILDLTNTQTTIDQYTNEGYTYNGIIDCKLNFSRVTTTISNSTDMHAFFDNTGSFSGDGLEQVKDAMQAFYDNYVSEHPDYVGNYYLYDTTDEQWLRYIQEVSDTYSGSTADKDILLISFCNESSPAYHSGTFNTPYTQLQKDTYMEDYNTYNSTVSVYNSVICVAYPIITTGASGSGSVAFANSGRALVAQTLLAMYGTAISESEFNTIIKNEVFSDSQWLQVKDVLMGTNPYAVTGLYDLGWKAQVDVNDLSGIVITPERLETDLNNLIFGGSSTTTEIVEIGIPTVDIRDETYFEDVSWTIAYKPGEGTWNSYSTFYPDYSPYFNNFFQVGYNWGNFKESVWNHLLNRSSFCVFQGVKNKPIIEFVVANENVNKMLNSVAINLEGRYYMNDWDFSTNKDKSFKNMFIYNSTNNSGMLELIPQKTLSDNRKYPITENTLQKILFTSDGGKQNINYFYNRAVNEKRLLNMFDTDKNNIFKTINNNAVNFKGRRILDRLKGEYFVVHLEGLLDSRFNLIFSNSINNETIEQ